MSKYFQSEYFPLYEGLKYKKEPLMTNVLFLLRRYTIAAVFVSMPSQRLLSIGLFVIWSFVTLTFLVTVKPFDDPKLNQDEIINEATISFIAYISFSFIDPKNELELIEVMGLVFITVCSLNIVYNLSLMILNSIY